MALENVLKLSIWEWLFIGISLAVLDIVFEFGIIQLVKRLFKIK